MNHVLRRGITLVFAFVLAGVIQRLSGQNDATFALLAGLAIAWVLDASYVDFAKRSHHDRH